MEEFVHYENNQQVNLIKAFEENIHHREYGYNTVHQLTRYANRTGRGQNIRYDSSAADAKAIEEWADNGSLKHD